MSCRSQSRDSQSQDPCDHSVPAMLPAAPALGTLQQVLVAVAVPSHVGAADKSSCCLAHPVPVAMGDQSFPR